MLGAGERVSGNEERMMRHVRQHGVDDGALDGPDIGDRRSGPERRGDVPHHVLHGSDGNAEDHEIGFGHGFGRGVEDLAESEPAGFVARLGRSGVAGDPGGQPGPPHGMGDRRGDEAEADERDVVVGHQARTRTKSASVSVTRAQAAASPTVMRRASGKP